VTSTTFGARCTLAEQFLPDAPYREMLIKLHNEMLAEIERLSKAVAEEREACALLVDENAKKCSKDSMAQMILFSNATAIRLRGNK
jgi:hypothetical protein